jgi:hypothetical protein
MVNKTSNGLCPAGQHSYRPVLSSNDTFQEGKIRTTLNKWFFVLCEKCGDTINDL